MKPGSTVKWTSEQQEAIFAPPGNLLVAAAAGAGKTAVLVERVIRRVLDSRQPVDIDRLLLVTFTEAAAAEMRQRIGAALEAALAASPGNRYLERQLALLGRASISTLHSFCLKVIRRYFYELELDPGFKVADEAEAALLAREVLDRLWEDKYAEEAPAGGPFTDLLDRYGNARDEDDLKDLVLEVYKFCRGQPWPEEWLRRAAAAFEVDEDTAIPATPWGPPLMRGAAAKLAEARSLLERATQLAACPGGPDKYLPNLERELAAVTKLEALARAGSWEELRRDLELSFDHLPQVRQKDGVDPCLKDRVTGLRDAVKDILKDLREDIFSRPERELVAELGRVGTAVRALVGLVLEFSRRFQAAKRQRGKVDFADLEHYALQLLSAPGAGPDELVPSALARELTEEYAEVLVDEYQDINPVQDAILHLISGQDGVRPHLFLVGDVKQSIYRFRLAEPRLFLAKYKSFAVQPGGRERRISLKANFRCRAEVVAAVNFLFRQLLTPDVGDLAYDRDAELVAGAVYPELPPGAVGAGGPVEVHLLERQDEAGPENATATEAASEGSGEEGQTGLSAAELSALEKEALLIGRRISAMVRGTVERPGPEFMVWDKAAKTYRPVTYRDIVILLRTVQGRAETILEVLRKLEIPAYAELGSGYFGAPEIATMLSLLKVIDNPRQDIPLAAVLRSPLVGLNAEELAEVRLVAPQGGFYTAVCMAARESASSSCREKLVRFLEQLNDWRTAARRGTLAELIWQIYRDTGFLAYVGGLPGGAQRQANLRALYDRARQFESFGRPGLFRFLRFLERFQAEEGDLGAARALGENENVVRIMSIHKSKGLEFPVVFVADLGKSFNLDDLKGDILFHRDLGLAPLVVDLELGLKYPSLAYRAVQEAGRQETLAEELRILYVALTRARERLVLVGSAKDLARQCRRWAQAAGASGWELPAATLLGARTYLDWLGPALARHNDGAALRVDAGSGSVDPAMAGDESRWLVSLHRAAEFAADGATNEKEASQEIEAELARARAQVTPELTREVQTRLTWRYPHSSASALAAKVSVSELKRRALLAAGGEDEEEPPRRFYPVRLSARPRFAQAEGDLAAAERGSAVHLVLQHLDLGRDLTAAGIKTQVAELVTREFLTPEQAESVDCDALAAFFAGPLGRRITAQPGAVRREVPFSLCLPAGEVYPAQATGDVTSEPILVQGVIDCLLPTEGGWLLLDFKTDRATPAALAEREQGYRKQIELYARAVEALSGRPVAEAYLYFLALGRAVPVPLPGEPAKNLAG